jgi:DNA/RNA endonuclease G (NUC1)
VWQKIFLERHNTNAAPQRSAINQGKQLWHGWKASSSTARTRGFKACAVTAPRILTKIRYLRGRAFRAPQEFWKMVVMEDSERDKPARARLLAQPSR